MLENRITAIALTRIELNNKGSHSTLEAKLYPGELKKMVSDPKHIYRDLKKVAKLITGRSILMENGNGDFKAFSLIPYAEYVNGVFTIKFNEELKDYIIGLKNNYTVFELEVVKKFKLNASFRLYEILKKEAYKIPKTKDGYTLAIYNLSELRFILGLANNESTLVRNSIATYKSNIDWDIVYSKLDKKDKKYEDWREFRRCIIEPARKELEEVSDICFDYKGIREGRSIKKILFTIRRNTPVETNQEQSISENDYDQLELLTMAHQELYREFIGHNDLTKEDIDLLLEKASYEETSVRRAIALADKQGQINNYVGWLIRCIENSYYETQTLSGSSKQAEIISNFKEKYEEEKPNISKSVWEKIKQKPEFEEFLSAIPGNLTESQLEVVYESEELVQMFTDWKLKMFSQKEAE